MIFGKYTLFKMSFWQFLQLAAYIHFPFCAPGNYDHYRNRPSLSQDLIKQSETVDDVNHVEICRSQNDLSTISLFNPSLKSLKSDRGDILYKH